MSAKVWFSAMDGKCYVDIPFRHSVYFYIYSANKQKCREPFPTKKILNNGCNIIRNKKQAKCMNSIKTESAQKKENHSKQALEKKLNLF